MATEHFRWVEHPTHHRLTKIFLAHWADQLEGYVFIGTTSSIEKPYDSYEVWACGENLVLRKA